MCYFLSRTVVKSVIGVMSGGQIPGQSYILHSTFFWRKLVSSIKELA